MVAPNRAALYLLREVKGRTAVACAGCGAGKAACGACIVLLSGAKTLGSCVIWACTISLF